MTKHLLKIESGFWSPATARRLSVVGFFAAWLTQYPLHSIAQPRLQSPTDALAPGTVPLLPRAPAPFTSEEVGQSSTGGTAQRSARIQQLVRIAMSSAAPTTPGKAGTSSITTSREVLVSQSVMTPGQASWLLGLLYLNGQGVPLDAAQAEHWFTLAWNQHEVIASAGLAWCALEGCAGPVNPAKAKHWIGVLRKPQPGRAQYLDWLLASKLSPVPGLSASRSQPTQNLDALLAKALAAGDAQAQATKGRQLFAQNRFSEALKFFENVASLSPAAAKNVELVKARMALESASGSNAQTTSRAALDADTIYQQARRMHRGEGVPANYTEAIRLYLLADRLGHKEARKMLSLIYSRPSPSGDVDIGWMHQLADLNITLPSPRVGQPSHALILHEDITPLMDLVPVSWRM